MAFDRPLEADKVEDNLLVSLVRGPILGSLMWILGEDEERKQQESDLQHGLQQMVLDDSDDEDQKTTNTKQKSLPRLVRSDLSVGMETAEENRCAIQEMPLMGMFQSAGSSDSILSSNRQQRGEKKKMSWSENLVEYMDEVRLLAALADSFVVSLVRWQFVILSLFRWSRNEFSPAFSRFLSLSSQSEFLAFLVYGYTEAG